MGCPRCGHDNPASTRFCGQCGASLSNTCPACRHANPAENKFCGECGTPLSPGPGAAGFTSPRSYTPRHLADSILRSRSALEGERKQVTVLFVDVAGFTTLSERLDPEDVHAVMRRAFEIMLAEVHRYEGTVNQFLGDGIMALFGAPVAHEDHARRAVYAALGIRAALDRYQDDLRRGRGLSFTVRQGLNSGLVVVGSIGGDLRMDYTAVGDTTNVAARLQQAASPGQILIAEPVQRLVEGYCATHALGDRAVKGKTEAVRVWELVSAQRARSRLDLGVDRGLTPLVGRERELTQLTGCFDHARSGRGQVAFVVGEPGIGKSRLLHEFRRRVGDEATWFEGRCLSFGQSMAFHPLVDLLRRALGIDDSEPEEAVAAKVRRRVGENGADFATVIPPFLYLLGANPGDDALAAMDPQERRAELFQALRRFFLRTAERAPQVLVFEDIQWMDGATEEWLAAMMHSVPASRWLLILTYRTGSAHPFGEQTYYTRIAPGALSEADTLAIARAALPAGRLSPDVEAAIARKADGNPFFVEEIVKSLEEGGAEVPDTIQDVITARIDRLGEGSKRVLQIASVIGRTFGRRLLDRVAGERAAELRELLRLEFIHETPAQAEVEYVFRHGLTQDVAYASLLSSSRREWHGVIGRAIEEMSTERPGEHSEVLAYHFERAEVWDRAIDCLMRAAARAAASFATRDAIALYNRAESIMTRLGDAVPAATRIAMHRARGDLYGVVSNFALAHGEAARAADVAREAGDGGAEGSAIVGMALMSFYAHEFDRALDESARAIGLGEATNTPTVVAGGHLAAASVFAVTGRLDEARDGFDKSLAISRPAGDAVSEANALVWTAEIVAWEARYDDAARLYDAGIRLARRHGALMPALEGMFMSGVNLTTKGDYDGALAILEESLALAEKVGDENYTPRTLNSLGWLYMECGALDRAEALNRLAAEQAHRRGDHEMIANAELNLGDIALQRGDHALARDILFGMKRLVEDPRTSTWGRWRYSLHCYASLADLAIARGDWAEARAHAGRCLADGIDTRSMKYVAKGRRLLGEIALGRRAWDEADAALREAITTAEAVGNPTQLWKTHVARARLAHARRHPDAAREAIRRADDVLDALKTRVRHPELQVALRANVRVPDLTN